MPGPNQNQNTNEDKPTYKAKKADAPIIRVTVSDTGTRTETTIYPDGTVTTDTTYADGSRTETTSNSTKTNTNIEGADTELPPGATWSNTSDTWNATWPDGTRWHYLGDGWVTVYPAGEGEGITIYIGPHSGPPSAPGDYPPPWGGRENFGERYEEPATPIDEDDRDDERNNEVPV